MGTAAAHESVGPRHREDFPEDHRHLSEDIRELGHNLRRLREGTRMFLLLFERGSFDLFFCDRVESVVAAIHLTSLLCAAGKWGIWALTRPAFRAREAVVVSDSVSDPGQGGGPQPARAGSEPI